MVMYKYQNDHGSYSFPIPTMLLYTMDHVDSIETTGNIFIIFNPFCSLRSNTQIRSLIKYHEHHQCEKIEKDILQRRLQKY